MLIRWPSEEWVKWLVKEYMVTEGGRKVEDRPGQAGESMRIYPV